MFRTAAERILYNAVTEHGVIHVVQERGNRALYFGNGPVQSRVSISTPYQPVLGYVQAMTAFLLFRPGCESVLQIGLGAGSLTHFLWHHFPAARIEVVEYHPVVIELAHRFFFLPHDERLVLHSGDGTQFVSAQTARAAAYDLLTIDAFDETGLASGLSESTFFEACRGHLDEDGILVMNLWHGQEDNFTTIAGRIDSVFDAQTLYLPVEGKGNVIVLAFNRARRLPDLTTLRRHARALEVRYGLPYPRLLHLLQKHNRDRDKPLVLR